MKALQAAGAARTGPFAALTRLGSRASRLLPVKHDDLNRFNTPIAAGCRDGRRRLDHSL